MLGKIIITSGPTKEWIDPVRYISNASSGLMGYSIAIHSKDLTENLVYIAGGTDTRYKSIPWAKNITVDTTEEMLNAVLNELEDDCLLVMAAAPADYRPMHSSDTKIKKKDSPTEGMLTIQMVENPDILKSVSKRVNSGNLKNVKRIGFSAETHDLATHAKGKLNSKDLDWILANSVGKGIGFGEVENTLNCFSRHGENFILGPLEKSDLAREVVKRILLPLWESKT